MSNAERILQCPICLETMNGPIIQCKKGHSMCQICITANSITVCPTCRGAMSKTRNFHLEQIIEQFKTSCKMTCTYSTDGCKFLLGTDEKESHERECKFRKFQCEGAKFAKWKCAWSGPLKDLEAHFKADHLRNTQMSFKTEAVIPIRFQDFRDIYLINFFNGSHFFWYKHKVDVAKEKVYWAIQLIGTEQQANNFYYEFEVFIGAIRKFKVTEICHNDCSDIDRIFDKENCVVMSFATVKNFLNADGDLSFKFRIMSAKKIQKS